MLFHKRFLLLVLHLSLQLYTLKNLFINKINHKYFFWQIIIVTFAKNIFVLGNPDSLTNFKFGSFRVSRNFFRQSRIISMNRLFTIFLLFYLFPNNQIIQITKIIIIIRWLFITISCYILNWFYSSKSLQTCQQLMTYLHYELSKLKCHYHRTIFAWVYFEILFLYQSRIYLVYT